jgi:hypothetical protein
LALLVGAVGERRRGDQGEPSGDLASPDSGEQALRLDLDPVVRERHGQPFSEVLQLIGGLGAGAGSQVQVVDLVH